MTAAPGGPSSIRSSPFGALPYGPRVEGALPALHRGFGLANRWFVVPAMRAGLGPLLGSPIGGYFLVLRTRGRRTGRWRDAPLAYAIRDGAVYVIAGFGPRAHWFRNLQADPKVEVRLPAGAFSGSAEEVTDPEERRAALRDVLRACGLVSPAFGLDPWRDTDEALARKSEGLPLVRVRPTGVLPGPADPGGRLWLGITLAWLGATWLAWRRSRRGPRDRRDRRMPGR